MSLSILLALEKLGRKGSKGGADILGVLCEVGLDKSEVLTDAGSQNA